MKKSDRDDTTDLGAFFFLKKSRGIVFVFFVFVFGQQTGKRDTVRLAAAAAAAMTGVLFFGV